MPTIHLVERKGNVSKTGDGQWKSGYWVVASETAERLVGGDLYLHTGPAVPSHFGGRIVGWRIYRDGSEIDGRIVFRLAATPQHKGVAAGRNGWGNEKKI